MDVEGSLKSALVVLHGLWSESHRSEGVGAAGHVHPNGIHLENVATTAVKLGGTHRAALGENILQRHAVLFKYASRGRAPNGVLPSSFPGRAPGEAHSTSEGDSKVVLTFHRELPKSPGAQKLALSAGQPPQDTWEVGTAWKTLQIT